MFIQLLFFGPGLPVDATALQSFSASPCIALWTSLSPFYKGRSVNFQLKKYYTDALTGMETAAISSILMDYSNQSLAPCHSPFLQGELCYFGN